MGRRQGYRGRMEIFFGDVGRMEKRMMVRDFWLGFVGVVIGTTIVAVFSVGPRNKEVTRLKAELDATIEENTSIKEHFVPRLRPEITELSVLLEIRDLLKEKQND